MNAPARRWITIFGMAAAMYAAGNFFQPTVVVGQSMAPTLRNGGVILVDRTYYRSHKPAPGEVVVFRLDGVTYVKRVYRGPGQTLYYLTDGGDLTTLVREVRGEEAKRRYRDKQTMFRVQKLRIPEDSVYVVGDNWDHSEDSRSFGPIPISSILGRAHLPTDSTRLLGCEYSPGAVITRARQRDRDAARQAAATSVVASARGM